jgi:succinoglycan biosynthesis protein ExoA
MRNESEHIENLIVDVAAQDFAGEVELLVADGCSTDGSVECLRAAAARRHVDVNVLENPQRWVSHALNACIRRATGDLVVRLDCHSRYPPDYLRRCAEAAAETDAMNVGGVFVPRGRTPMERAVAAAMDSPFGGIHWTRDANAATRVEADTVPYGAYRPRAFDLAGYFDESLVRDQDDEFNLRLRRAGGRILLDPAIRVFYTPRGSLRAVFRQYFEYGLWKIPVILRHGRVPSLRSLAPIGFVGSIVALGCLAGWIGAARWLLLAELTAYALGALVFGALSIRARREPLRLLPRVVAAYATFHLSYGLGMFTGTANAIRSRRADGGVRSV